MDHDEAKPGAGLNLRWAVCAVAACSLGACASGSSSSFTQAPISFSSDDGAVTNSSGELVALANGDFANGVPQFTAVAGNSVLPVNAATPLGGLVATQSLVATELTPGAVTANANLGALGSAGIALSAQTPGLSIAANTPLAGVGAGLNAGGATLSATAPLLGPVATPLTATVALPTAVTSVVNTAGGALPTRGAVLAAGGAVSFVTAGSLSAVNGLLSTVATQQQKVRICGLKPTC